MNLRGATTAMPALAGAALLLALQAGGDPLRLWLRYDRQAVLSGELWRLVTAHLVHLGWAHALLNAAGLLLCAVLAPGAFVPGRVGRLCLQLAGLGLGVSLMLLALSPQVAHYAGLSGVLYGLFVVGLAPAARRREPPAVAALLLLAAWMLWQWVAGPSADEERVIGGRIITVAHLYGMAAAALIVAARPRR